VLKQGIKELNNSLQEEGLLINDHLQLLFTTTWDIPSLLPKDSKAIEGRFHKDSDASIEKWIYLIFRSFMGFFGVLRENREFLLICIHLT
jgi:hypothetical protein